MKTKAWTIETTTSSNNSNKIKVEVIKIPGVKKEIRENVILDASKSKRCPAVKFAIIRIARVTGRIRALIVSIMITKGIKRVGVPSGRKWLKV